MDDEPRGESAARYLKDKVEAYMHTIGRLEPDITAIDVDAAAASAAISLRRIADGLDRLNARLTATGLAALIDELRPIIERMENAG